MTAHSVGDQGWRHQLTALMRGLDVGSVPLLPEIRLHLASDVFALWKETERLFGHEMDMPYWAFAWSGGQALARYMLDNPEEVTERAVFDLGSGSGLVAIAAKMAGARSVSAYDPDPFSKAAIAVNAGINVVELTAIEEPPEPDQPEVVTAGDMFYEKGMAVEIGAKLTDFARAGARVLVGDPRRGFLPSSEYRTLATYEVPVMREVEEGQLKRAAVLGHRISSEL